MPCLLCCKYSCNFCNLKNRNDIDVLKCTEFDGLKTDCNRPILITFRKENEDERISIDH